MTTWFRSYWGEEDIWFYFEVDQDGWVTRQIELQGPERTPIAAACLQEWQAICESGDAADYEARYGWTATLPVQEWEGHDPQALTAREFEASWAKARRQLADTDDGTASNPTS